MGVDLSKTPDTVGSETEWHPWFFREVKSSPLDTRFFRRSYGKQNRWKTYKLRVREIINQIYSRQLEKESSFRRIMNHWLTRYRYLSFVSRACETRQIPRSSNVSFQTSYSFTSTIRENWIHACYSRYWVSRYGRYPNSSNSVCQTGRTPVLAHGTLASLMGNAPTIQSSSRFSNFYTKPVSGAKHKPEKHLWCVLSYTTYFIMRERIINKTFRAVHV